VGPVSTPEPLSQDVKAGLASSGMSRDSTHRSRLAPGRAALPRPATGSRLGLTGSHPGSAWRWLGVVGAAAALLLGLEALGVDTSELTRDPGAVAELPQHVGLISTLGVMLWAAAAGACLLAARALATRGGDSRRAEFLLVTGVLLAVLGIDDGLQVHENIPMYAPVPEVVLYALFGMVVALYSIRYLDLLLEQERLLLGLGFSCLALGAALDVPGGVPFTVEDFPKLIGVVAVSAWAFARSLGALTRAPTS
jgi:hypothetical protein